MTREVERDTFAMRSRRARLRWRRRWYAYRWDAGFMRTGSWKHLMYSVVHPEPVHYLNLPLRAGLVGLLWVAALGGFSLAGLGPARSAFWAAVLVVGVWLLVGVGSFVFDVVRARSQGPRWHPPDAGMREPRRPAPNLDAGAIRLDLPNTPVGE